MDLRAHFRSMALYNRRANVVLFDACAQLDDAVYRKQRPVFFNSIHGTLNHLLLGDGIWMTRFEGGVSASTRLDAILHNTLPELREARARMDRRIEAFFGQLTDAQLETAYLYTNNQGRDVSDTAPVAYAHFFNHQTHHRGQVHALLSQTDVPPPSLDLHRLLNPV